MGLKVALTTLGCSKNMVDGENMLGLLQDADFEIVENEEDAEIIIVNTCCFIEDAKQESINTIIDMADFKGKKCKKLIVTGCLAERYKEQVLEQLPEVDCIVGVGGIYDIVNAIKSDQNKFVDKPYVYNGKNRVLLTPPYTAYLKIADGCDNCCTYCVIPSIRGKFVSRPMEDLIEEAKTLAKSGVVELNVVAQDTTNYGIDIYGEYRLSNLLNELCKIDGIKWIRVHYCYPERITDELIYTMANQPKICKYLDLPIQHCSDKILKLMARKSTKKQLVDLIEKLRKQIPNLVLRTTLIAGFPGETDDDVAEMEEFINTIKFERLGVFAYSKEEDTPAFNMKNQVDEQVKIDRADMLTFAQADIAENFSKSLINRTFQVLVEGYDNIIKSYFGRTYMDSLEVDGKVFFKSADKLEPGDFAMVTIDEADDYDLFGSVEGDKI